MYPSPSFFRCIESQGPEAESKKHLDHDLSWGALRQIKSRHLMRRDWRDLPSCFKSSLDGPTLPSHCTYNRLPSYLPNKLSPWKKKKNSFNILKTILFIKVKRRNKVLEFVKLHKKTTLSASVTWKSEKSLFTWETNLPNSYVEYKTKCFHVQVDGQPWGNNI